jgi:DNA polymerase (family 10)
LRKGAQEKGYTLSEYGLQPKSRKKMKIDIKTEEHIYSFFGMDYIPPELREGTNELDRAQNKQIPILLERSDLRGDLHVHTDFPIEPSHDLGKSSVVPLAEAAKRLNYTYLGLADHNPAHTTHSESENISLLLKRKDTIEQFNTNLDYIELKSCLEVDILSDAKLALSDNSLKLNDLVIAGIHSAHKQPREKIMQRFEKAVKHPSIHLISHPTGRLLLAREASEADWDTVFEWCAEYHTILEINASPQRMDLPDFLVQRAKEYGVVFAVNSDAHDAESLPLIAYGIDTARRGWCTKQDIVNTWDWDKLVDYLRNGGKDI